MKNSLTNLYENMYLDEEMLLNEIMGALNYWISPKGQLIPVPPNLTHMKFAQDNFDDINWIQYKQDVISGAVSWRDSYQVVYKAGYVRVVEQEFTIYISYNRAKPPNSAQVHTLKEMCEDREKNLYDDETNKVLIKQNEVNPNLHSKTALADKLSNELKAQGPSFYKNRPFGDSFSAYDLNDYTKIIYEYNIPEEIPQSTPNNYRSDVPEPKPLVKNKEDDLKQALIYQAIDNIQKAHNGEGILDLKETVKEWQDHLEHHGFTPEEIRQVVEMGLGYFDKVRKKPFFDG